MEPEGSLPHSQQPATCPYPEPARSSPHPHIPLPDVSSYYYPPIYVCVSKWSLSQYTSLLSPIPATCPARLILLNLITQKIFGEEYRSLSSSYVPKYSPQHPTLQRPQHTFLPQCERPSFIPIQNNRQNHSSAYPIFK